MQNEAVALLRCPICSGSFHQEGKSLLCGKRHCYDIAKQGHVNFERQTVLLQKGAV